MASENLVYSSRVQNSISFRSSAPMLPACRAVDIQAVKSGSMVENGAELIVNRFQIGFGQRLAVAVPHFPNLVLPAHNVLGCNLRQLPLGKVRQNLLFDDALLGEPSVELQLGLNVPLIESNEALKGHVHIGLLLHQELPFPFQRFSFGGKTTLEFLLALTLPVGVAELHIPGAVVLVLNAAMITPPFSLFGSRAIKLLVEELAVDPAGNRDAAGFRQFLVHLPDELVGIGYGYSQLLGHFIDAHKIWFAMINTFLSLLLVTAACGCCVS